MRAIDLTGQQFSMLTVIRLLPDVDKFKKRQWLCSCSCGSETILTTERLRGGLEKSCGCYGKSGMSHRTHGMSKISKPEYGIWKNMKKRCFNENTKDYPYYGGRGITVSEAWAESFESFLKDMGDRPSSTHTIDRINNNGNYESGNCRWATKSEQALNRRPRRSVAA